LGSSTTITSFRDKLYEKKPLYKKVSLNCLLRNSFKVRRKAEKHKKEQKIPRGSYYTDAHTKTDPEPKQNQEPFHFISTKKNNPRRNQKRRKKQ